MKTDKEILQLVLAALNAPEHVHVHDAGDFSNRPCRSCAGRDLRDDAAIELVSLLSRM